jgi:hypothetical protein
MIRYYKKPYCTVQTYCMFCVYVSQNKVQSNSRFELYSKIQRLWGFHLSLNVWFFSTPPIFRQYIFVDYRHRVYLAYYFRDAVNFCHSEGNSRGLTAVFCVLTFVMFCWHDVMDMWLSSLSWVADACGSSDAITYLLQIQGRDGRYVVGFCKVQVLLVTIPPYWLFDTSDKSKYGADALYKVLPNAPDSRSWINTKLSIQSVT